MGEEAGQRCVSPPAAIGACTLADRRNNVHCLRYGPHISAINPRVRFVIRPSSNTPSYRHEDHFSPPKFCAPLTSAIEKPKRASTFFSSEVLHPVDHKKRFPRSQSENLQIEIFGRRNSCDSWSTRRGRRAAYITKATLMTHEGHSTGRRPLRGAPCNDGEG
jgi:hypothetical protein